MQFFAFQSIYFLPYLLFSIFVSILAKKGQLQIMFVFYKFAIIKVNYYKIKMKRPTYFKLVLLFLVILIGVVLLMWNNAERKRQQMEEEITMMEETDMMEIDDSLYNIDAVEIDINPNLKNKYKTSPRKSIWDFDEY